MDVTGQNVSNVNTDGYSRQRVELQSINGSTGPALWSIGDGIGDGVNSDSVTRIRDAFLESRAQTEHAKNSQLTAEDDALTQIQQAFNEPTSGSGISVQLTNVWSSWQALANAPTGAGSDAAGTALLTTTQTLVDGLNTARATLGKQWTATQSDLSSVVEDANSTAGDIAKLNQAIRRATQSGQPANELSDQRDALVLKLADSMGATSKPAADGMVNVVIGGISLVSGTSAAALALAGPTDMDKVTGAPTADVMTTGTPRIVTTVGYATVNAGGTAGGYLNALTNLIPTYGGELDAFAADFARQVNAAQQGTSDSPVYDAKGTKGAGPSSTPGTSAMFGSSGGTGTAITAATIRLNFTDPKLIATSSVAPTMAADGTTVLTPAVDGSNADRIAQIGRAAGSPDSTYRAMMVKLGVQASSTSSNLQIQNTVASTVDNNRESVSGVDLDEEMTNMLSYQHAYSAAAQLISVINQNLDALMNMVGN
jgi:flagellar hook-associated protein 1 FlgK